MTWRRLVLTAQFVLKRHCTHYFQRSYSSGFTPGLTVDSQLIRGGFRRSYQTVDHLATYRMLEHRCREWGIKMRVAIVDFAKVFDTIRHKSLWSALEQFGIEPQYISLLSRLHADQKATVLTDKESDVFEIKRGTKQGDPLNSSLFNTVLLAALRNDLKQWREKARAYVRANSKQIAPQTNGLETTCCYSQHHWSS